MRNFEFYNPTRIVFGKAKTGKIGEVTAPYGKRVLLLYGQGSVKQNGVLANVQASLRAAGVEWVECGGVKPNPVLTFVHAAIEQFKSERLEAIVAVGGGSVIDTAKAVAAGVCYQGEVWDFFCGLAQVEEAVPITTVLTLAATASEMNNGGVITKEDTAEKYHLSGTPLYPKVSILDPENTFSVPQNHSMYGAVDAIIHLLEGYFNASDSHLPLQDRLVEGLILTIMEAAEVISKDPTDYTARANMMWSASLALNGLTTAGTGNTGFPMHMIEHALSALYDIPHGAGLAIVAPAWMRYACQKRPEKFAQFAQRVFQLEHINLEEQALAGIQALEAWFVKIKTPVRMETAHIPIQDIGKIAENANRLAHLWGMPEYSPQVIETILKHACA